jgi:hypothetical protein
MTGRWTGGKGEHERYKGDKGCAGETHENAKDKGDLGAGQRRVTVH